VPKSGVDYATDNITVYRRPCPYGCLYCWAWRAPLFSSRIARGSYDPVREAERYARMGSRRTVVVSFTSDPYPPQEEALGVTRRVLGALSTSNHKVLVLTKNPALALRDLDIFKSHRDMWLGTTVTSLQLTRWEPEAPDPRRRLEALRAAHEEGVRTWLSIEPIIPGATYPEAIVSETLDYVDWYVLGALNYAKRVAGIGEGALRAWYEAHVVEAVEVLKSRGKPFHVKEELRRLLARAGVELA